MRVNWALASLGVILASVVGGAQVAAQPAGEAGAVQRQREQEREQREALERLERAREADGDPAVRSDAPEEADSGVSDDKVIPVTRIAFTTSQVLSEQQLQQLAQPYEGQTVSVRELVNLTEQINQLYAQLGYPTARAVLPPQEIRDGVVEIRLVESALGEVKLENRSHLRENYVSDRVGLAPGQLLSVTDLERDLVRFNRLNDANLRARLTPGADFGTTDVIIDVEEPDPFSLITFVDNAGRETVGRERIGGVFRAASVLGVSDPLQITGDLSEGSNSFSISYSLPLTPSDLRLEASYSRGDIEVVNGPFRVLDIDGDSEDVTFGLSHPLWVEPNSHWLGYGRFSLRETTSSFAGVEQQNLDLRVFTLGISWQAEDQHGLWYMNHQTNFGANDFGGEQSFTVYRGSITRFQRLPGEFSLVARAGWQASHQNIIPASEQFQIGGSYTVRGYEEGLLNGRHGYYTSLEMRLPVVRTDRGLLSAEIGDRLDLFTFVDHGGVFPYKGAGGDIDSDDFLTSAGAGLMWDVSDRLSGRVTVGFPLTDNSFATDNSDARLHFYVQLKWF